jgi:hypothetical protein
VNRGRSTRCRGSQDKTRRSRSRGCRSTARRRLAGRHGRGRAGAVLVFHRSRHVRTHGLPGNSHHRGPPESAAVACDGEATALPSFHGGPRRAVSERDHQEGGAEQAG